MFYTQTKPPLDSICFVELANYNIKNTDLGIYVKLIDYNMIDGFIPLTEISKYQVNYQRLFKHDKVYPCLVHSYEKDLINLSFMRIKEKERERLLEQFVFAQRINILCNTVYKFSDENIKLLENHMFNDSSVEELYNNILEDPVQYFGNKSGNHLKEKIKMEPYESHKEFQLIICQDDGLNKLKFILNKFEDYISGNSYDGKIECISSPIYAIRLKHIAPQPDYIADIFDNFQKIIDDNHVKALFKELELKTFKQKQYHFNN
jgi:translation initiation factor 2 alpha subunit (eIF-2alpha)